VPVDAFFVNVKTQDRAVHSCSSSG